MKTKQLTLIASFLIISQTIVGQVDQSQDIKGTTTDTTRHWESNIFLNLGINGSIFYNWTAGGESNLALQGIAKINTDYKKDKLKFTNELDLIYGLSSGHGKLLVKQTDLIQLESEFNYRLTNRFHLSLLTHLTTQFSPGYVYSESSTGSEVKTKISSFLSPGLSNEGIGINMIGKFYEIGLAPVGMQQTIVLDPDVDTNIYGLPSGKVKNEFGTYLSANANLELLKKKLSLDTDLILFMQYNDIGNIDILFKYLIEYKISKVFSINSSMVVIYDNDIGRPELVDTNFNGIPDSVSESNSKLQLKQLLSIGINLSL